METANGRTVIALLIPDLQLGGAERQVALLAANIGSSQFVPLVITLRPAGALVEELERKRISIHCLSAKSPFRVLWRLLSCLRKNNVEILHSFLLTANAYALLARLLMPRLRVVTGVRDAIEDRRIWETSLRERLRTRMLLSVVGALRHFAVAQIANSRTAVRIAHRHGDPKLQVILNGVDVTRWAPAVSARHRLRQQYNIPAATRVVATVANCSAYKDYPTLIRAAARVLYVHSDVVFLAFGNTATAEGEKARALVHQLGIHRRFLFAGLLRDLQLFLPGADVFCLASAVEAFPNATSEAMSCGVPPVVTDVGDSAMIVGDTGIVVPPHSFEKLAEAIGRLLDFGETERRQLGSMARDRIVLQFSIEKMVKSHEALYCRVLGIAMQERRLSTGLEGSGAE